MIRIGCPHVLPTRLGHEADAAECRVVQEIWSLKQDTKSLPQYVTVNNQSCMRRDGRRGLSVPSKSFKAV